VGIDVSVLIEFRAEVVRAGLYWLDRAGLAAPVGCDGAEPWVDAPELPDGDDVFVPPD
jgi:hypothetical protein